MINLAHGQPRLARRAIHYFEKRPDDPNYAGAWAALSAAYRSEGGFLSIPSCRTRLSSLAKTAIKLNPRLSHAHQFLGGAYNTLGATMRLLRR